jgi:hypothetical protein
MDRRLPDRRRGRLLYYKLLLQAKEQKGIDFVPIDPLMQVRAYFDIGGTGARADAVAIWICQFVGQKINVLDYYEAQGQPLSVHLDWMRSRGWGKALVSCRMTARPVIRSLRRHTRARSAKHSLMCS